MGVLEKIPRQGSIAVRQLTVALELSRLHGDITMEELAPSVGKTEEVLSMSPAAVQFPTVAEEYQFRSLRYECF